MPVTSDPDLDAQVDGTRPRWPAVALAAGVLRDGQLEAFAGFGVADIAARTPVMAGTAFRVASTTRTLTAGAVLQLVERGAAALGRPAATPRGPARAVRDAGSARVGHGCAAALGHRRRCAGRRPSRAAADPLPAPPDGLRCGCLGGRLLRVLAVGRGRGRPWA
jgi:CubicO group peptidase (beta-lactamase class C family)